MLGLALPLRGRQQPKILCLGAHPDDIEIGAGGTVLSLLQRYPEAHVHWAVFSGSRERGQEARSGARSFLGPTGSSEVVVHSIRDGFFPAEFAHLKELFEGLKHAVDPDIIFTHYRNDGHQDHRAVSELTANTYRHHLVLEYEIPKYDPDLGNPNFLVPLSKEHVDRKVAALMRNFPSQRARQWFTPDTFYGLMRLRGVQCAATSGFAEGFHVSKLCLDLGIDEWRAAGAVREDEHRRSLVSEPPVS